MLIKLPLKVKISHKNKGRGGGSHHTAHVGGHLENYYDEAGCDSIKERLLEKVKKIIKHEEGDSEG